MEDNAGRDAGGRGVGARALHDGARAVAAAEPAGAARKCRGGLECDGAAAAERVEQVRCRARLR